MVTSALWNGLRAKLGAAAGTRRPIAVQHLVLSESDVGIVQAMLDKAGKELAVRFELRSDAGEIVLLDGELAQRMSMQLIDAFKDDRPMVVIASSRSDDQRRLSVAERFERRQHELLRQLRKIAIVRRRAAQGGGVWTDGDSADDIPHGAPASARAVAYDSGFDSRLDVEQLSSEELQSSQWQMLQQVLQGRHAPQTPRLAASYGPAANMVFDFQARMVSFDPLALQHLRVRRELPQAAPGAQPCADAVARRLNETLWDMGIASGPMPLIDAPADWWHAPLASPLTARVEHHTRIPRYLEVARRLREGPATPSELRRLARIGVLDLRRLLQACLMSDLAQWVTADSKQEGAL